VADTIIRTVGKTGGLQMRKLSKKRGYRRITGAYWLFCIPALIVLIVVIGVPVGYTAQLSLFELNLMIGREGFVGLDNYIHAFTDPGFWVAIGRTLIYVVVVGFLDLVLGFVQAMIIFSVPRRVGRVLRVIFVLPILLIPSAAAVFWSEVMYGAPFQEFNRLFGIPLEWPILGMTDTAFLGILLTVIWAWSAWSFILISSGLESLNRDVLDAAMLDGAGYFKTIRHIILPLLKPVIFVTVIFKAVGSLNAFAFPWPMTQGGPANSSQVFGTYIYSSSFDLLDFGQGAAQSMIMLVIGTVAAVIAARAAARNNQVI
jgi:ABC-type sugar transport system permease subunit